MVVRAFNLPSALEEARSDGKEFSRSIGRFSSRSGPSPPIAMNPLWTEVSALPEAVRRLALRGRPDGRRQFRPYSGESRIRS